MTCTLRFARRACAIALVAVGVFAAAPAAGQERRTLPATVTLEDVLKMLEEVSPRTAAERAAISVVAADRISANTLPNPTFNYDAAHLVSGLSTGATTQHQFSVDVPLLLSHQRSARLDSATLNLSAEQARVDQVLAERRLDVRRTFASLLARQMQLEIVKDSLADLERVAALVRARAAAGDRSQYDVLRINTEVASVRVDAMNAATDVEEVAGQLATLVGAPGWSPHAVGALAEITVDMDVDALWKTAQQQRPVIVALRQQQAAARGGLFLANRERLPVPVLTGGAQLTNNVNGASAVVGISVPLTLFDRNQGAIAKASAQAHAADLAVEATLAEVRAEIEHAAAVLSARRAALTALDQTVMSETPTLRRMAEDAYKEGSADILELLDASRSLRGFQLARAQQLEAVALAEEAVISAAGLDGSVAPFLPPLRF